MVPRPLHGRAAQDQARIQKSERCPSSPNRHSAWVRALSGRRSPAAAWFASSHLRRASASAPARSPACADAGLRSRLWLMRALTVMTRLRHDDVSRSIHQERSRIMGNERISTAHRPLLMAALTGLVPGRGLSCRRRDGHGARLSVRRGQQSVRLLEFRQDAAVACMARSQVDATERARAGASRRASCRGKPDCRCRRSISSTTRSPTRSPPGAIPNMPRCA